MCGDVHINFSLGFLDCSLVQSLVLECTKMSTLNHPNVLTVIGVCLDGGPAPYIVMPYMHNGSLLSYLRKNKDNLIISPEHEEDSVMVCHNNIYVTY